MLSRLNLNQDIFYFGQPDNRDTSSNVGNMQRSFNFESQEEVRFAERAFRDMMLASLDNPDLNLRRYYVSKFDTISHGDMLECLLKLLDSQKGQRVVNLPAFAFPCDTMFASLFLENYAAYCWNEHREYLQRMRHHSDTIFTIHLVNDASLTEGVIFSPPPPLSLEENL